MNRREMMIRTGAAALGAALWRLTPALAADGKPKKILFFSKSSNFEHAVIKHVDATRSFVEKLLSEFGPKHGVEFTFSKDGSLFSKEYVEQFDAFMFYTSGDLLSKGKDENPPMTV